MFFGGLKLRRPSKNSKSSTTKNNNGNNINNKDRKHPISSPAKKNRQYVNVNNNQPVNEEEGDGADFWSELEQSNAPLSPYSMLKQMSRTKTTNLQPQQQQQQHIQQNSNNNKNHHTNSSAVNRLMQLKHNYMNPPDTSNIQRRNINHGLPPQQLTSNDPNVKRGNNYMNHTTSSKQQQQQHTSRNNNNNNNDKKKSISKNNKQESLLSEKKYNDIMALSPYSMLKKQQQRNRYDDDSDDNNRLFKINPEKLSGGIGLSGSLSARERALDAKLRQDMKIETADDANGTHSQQGMGSKNSINIYNYKPSSILNVDLGNLDQLTDEEINELFFKSLDEVEQYQQIRDANRLQFQKLEKQRVEMERQYAQEKAVRNATKGTLEQQIKRSEKEICNLYDAIEITQKRYDGQAIEIEELKHKLYEIGKPNGVKDEEINFDALLAKYKDDDKDALIRALYSANCNRKYLEEELVRTKGTARRDRLAYKNLLNEKFALLINNKDNTNNIEHAVVIQLTALKTRIEELEEENKITNTVYKTRLSRLHSDFSRQYIKLRELQERNNKQTEK